MKSGDTLEGEMKQLRGKTLKTCQVDGCLYKLPDGPSHGGFTADEIGVKFRSKRFTNGGTSASYFTSVVAPTKAERKRSIKRRKVDETPKIVPVYEWIASAQKAVIKFVLFRGSPTVDDLALFRATFGFEPTPVAGYFLEWHRQKWCATTTSQPLMTHHLPIAHG